MDKIIKYNTDNTDCEIMFDGFNKRVKYITINKDTNREITVINSDIKHIQEILNTFDFLKIGVD